MKTALKILTALAAVAGAVYVVATYGDKIVAWAKDLLAKCPCKCNVDDCKCEGECECGDACSCACTLALSTMAVANGCSEGVSREAAKPSSSFSFPPAARMSVTTGFPCVRVPVLSRTMVSMLCSCSRA